MSGVQGSDPAATTGNAEQSAEQATEESVTLQELLDEEESLQADAAAVLGGSDEKNCSYPHGYVDRQALYACSTCTPPGKDPAGICLACSYACHEGHDLYELYTKRNFRCDCGNDRFGDFKCSLFPAKSAGNRDNLYNHNFSGKYCRCARPYPDPERTEPEEMVQCVVCEDWFHLNHVGLKGVAIDSIDELICDECMKAHPFLWKYKLNIGSLSSSVSLGSAVDVETESIAKRPRIEICDPADKSSVEKDEAHCIFSRLPEPESVPETGAVWPTSWRRILCRCEGCTSLYETEKLSFLPSPDDTMRAYEKRGEKKREGAPDPLMNALNGLGHVQKIEMIDGYNNLKNCLGDFLRERAEANAVVTTEDVHNFFKGMKEMQSKKAAAVPGFFCR
ncbi:putative E3 ubiquitin-protein ligase UBR7 [Galendromus occidentalis]|uniref:E3 ubiquitin-protein ligase UBR7 n=1 Tax=Galendromus occidentalis TaxID=34638 RepID=A0AAJ6QPH4_9ACAR|nr:putative E3 ubiquitin-protein ligase UBR7 [Galendromus occidentalis]